MARMIDIDDVERILWDHHFHDGDGLQALCDVAEILEAVRGHPGVVDIVRCKECKMWNTEWKHEAGDCYCYKFFQFTDPDFFCAGGERRDTDANGT